MSTENSTEYANTVANPPRRNRPDQQHGRKRVATFTHTQVAQGADGSTINLCVIPAGRGRILKKESWAMFSALGSSRTLDIGHTGWTKADGTAQAAVADVLADGVDVSSATSAVLGIGTNADDSIWLTFDSKTPIVIQALIAGGTLDAAETAEGYITYIID